VLRRDRIHELNRFLDDFVPYPVNSATFVSEKFWDNGNSSIVHAETILENQKLKLVDYGITNSGVALEFENEYQLICFKMYFNPEL